MDMKTIAASPIGGLNSEIPLCMYTDMPEEYIWLCLCFAVAKYLLRLLCTSWRILAWPAKAREDELNGNVNICLGSSGNWGCRTKLIQV